MKFARPFFSEIRKEVRLGNMFSSQDLDEEFLRGIISLAKDQKKPLVVKGLGIKKKEKKELTAVDSDSLALRSLDLRGSKNRVVVDKKKTRTPSSIPSEKSSKRPTIVKILDVDRLTLNELHHRFMYMLVRRFLNEKILKLIGKLGQFRSKGCLHHSYENLHYIRRQPVLSSSSFGPELVALFSRCYATISIPFMLDYTRKFGRFSRNFIAARVDRSGVASYFDFVRYSQFGGQRPLDPIVAKPFELMSFTRLLPKCAAKTYIIQHFLAHRIKKSEKSLENQKLYSMRADEVSEEVGFEGRIAEALIQRRATPSIRDMIRKETVEGIATTLEDLEEFSVKTSRNELRNDPYILQSLRVHAFSDNPENGIDIFKSRKNEVDDLKEFKSSFEDLNELKGRRKTFISCGKKYQLLKGKGWVRILQKKIDFSANHRKLQKIRMREKRQIRLKRRANFIKSELVKNKQNG